MSALRDEIRAILREELAAIIAEQSGKVVQRVRVETSDDLNAFARDLVDQMSKPKFAGKVKSGEISFALEQSTQPSTSIVAPAIPVTTPIAAKTKTAVLDKKLITETDLAAIAPGALRIPRNARVTPLAKDKARRKGVRSERTDS